VVHRIQALGPTIGKPVRCAVPQHEHQQSVIIALPQANQLAIGIDRHLHPIQRAVHCHILDPLDAQLQRHFPRFAKCLCARLAAQIICALSAHIHSGGGGLNAAGIGQRLDKGVLAFGGPAIMPLGLARDGGEGGKLARRYWEPGFAGV